MKPDVANGENCEEANKRSDETTRNFGALQRSKRNTLCLYSDLCLKKLAGRCFDVVTHVINGT